MRFIACFVLFITMTAAFGQQPPATGTANASPVATKSSPVADENAKKIAGLQKNIEKQQKEIQELKDLLQNKTSELSVNLKTVEKSATAVASSLNTVEKIAKRVQPTTMGLVDKVQGYYQNNFIALLAVLAILVTIFIGVLSGVYYLFNDKLYKELETKVDTELQKISEKSGEIEDDLEKATTLSTEAKETAGGLQKKTEEHQKMITDHKENMARDKKNFATELFHLYEHLSEEETDKSDIVILYYAISALQQAYVTDDTADMEFILDRIERSLDNLAATPKEKIFEDIYINRLKTHFVAAVLTKGRRVRPLYKDRLLELFKKHMEIISRLQLHIDNPK